MLHDSELHLTNPVLLQVLVFVNANAPTVKWEVHLTMSVFHEMLFSVNANAPIVKWAVHLTMSVFQIMLFSVKPVAPIVKRSWFFNSKEIFIYFELKNQLHFTIGTVGLTENSIL